MLNWFSPILLNTYTFKIWKPPPRDSSDKMHKLNHYSSIWDLSVLRLLWVNYKQCHNRHNILPGHDLMQCCVIVSNNSNKVNKLKLKCCVNILRSYLILLEYTCHNFSLCHVCKMSTCAMNIKSNHFLRLLFYWYRFDMVLSIHNCKSFSRSCKTLRKYRNSHTSFLSWRDFETIKW